MFIRTIFDTTKKKMKKVFHYPQIFTIIGTTATAANQIAGTFDRIGNAVITFVAIVGGTFAQRMLNRYYQLIEIRKYKIEEFDLINDLLPKLSKLEDIEKNEDKKEMPRKEKTEFEAKKIELIQSINNQPKDYSYIICMTLASGLFITGTIINCQAEVSTGVRYSGYAANTTGILIAMITSLLSDKKINNILEDTKNSTLEITKSLTKINKRIAEIRFPTMPTLLQEANGSEKLWLDQNSLNELINQLQRQITTLNERKIHSELVDIKSIVNQSNLTIPDDKFDINNRDATLLANPDSFVLQSINKNTM